MRFLIRILITAVTLAFILPIVPGVHFHGAFAPTAIVYALLFSIIAWLVEVGLKLATGLLNGLSLGLALLITVPLWACCWWLVPALQLEALAHWYPQHFSIDSFGSAAIAGLVLLVINLFTRSSAK